MFEVIPVLSPPSYPFLPCTFDFEQSIFAEAVIEIHRKFDRQFGRQFGRWFGRR